MEKEGLKGITREVSKSTRNTSVWKHVNSPYLLFVWYIQSNRAYALWWLFCPGVHLVSVKIPEFAVQLPYSINVCYDPNVPVPVIHR